MATATHRDKGDVWLVNQIVPLPLEKWVGLVLDNEHNVSCEDGVTVNK